MQIVLVGVVLAALSHFWASFFPFAAKEVISTAGYLEAVLFFYLIGSGACIVLATFSALKKEQILKALTELLRSAHLQLVLISSIASALAYYFGLSATTDLAAFIFATRLDWIIQLVIGISLLREGFTRCGIFGAVLAALGGIMLAWERLSGAVILAAAAFVIFSVLSHTLARKVLSERILSAFGLLTLRNIAISLVLSIFFVTQKVLKTQPSMQGFMLEDHGLLLLAAGALLLALFWSRFAAFERIPVWLYAALAPIQPFMTIVILFVIGQVAVSRFLLIGISLVLTGELLCTVTEIKKARPIAVSF